MVPLLNPKTRVLTARTLMEPSSTLIPVSPTISLLSELIFIFIDNGGKGGESSSGNASVMNAPGSQQDGSTSSANTGATGSANGGSVTTNGGLFNVNSSMFLVAIISHLR